MGCDFYFIASARCGVGFDVAMALQFLEEECVQVVKMCGIAHGGERCVESQVVATLQAIQLAGVLGQRSVGKTQANVSTMRSFMVI